MNNKICANCNQSNAPEMSFCLNCGAELAHISPDEPPPTVMGGSFPTIPPAGQTSPNFQPPQFQQPNFQQPSFQPNFQIPQFQNAPAESGGNMTKILVGIGGALIGLFMLVAGGLQLYKVSGGSASPSPTPYLLTETNTGNKSDTGSVNKSKSNNMNSSNPTQNNSSSSSFYKLADVIQPNVGDWTLRDTITGDPEKDGFSGASEEKQLKYYDSSNAMVHLTIAQFPTAYDAQKSLRTSMQKFKTLKLSVSEETAAGDNDGNEIGIVQTMASANGKIFTCYWTNKNILMRALGTETDVEKFFKKSQF